MYIYIYTYDFPMRAKATVGPALGSSCGSEIFFPIRYSRDVRTEIIKGSYAPSSKLPERGDILGTLLGGY